MKKLLTTFIVSGFTMATFAQGTVNWTGVGPNFAAQTNATVYSSFFGGGPAGGGTVGNTAGSTATLYYYELLVSPVSTTAPASFSDLSTWLDTGLEAQNAISANGRILQLNGFPNSVANNWPAGVTNNLIMVGWSANLGTTWSAALANLENWSTYSASVADNAFFGVGSSVGSLPIYTGSPGITVLGSGPGQINNGVSNPMQMDLLPVPEPGTLALTALGGLSLLAFRRK